MIPEELQEAAEEWINFGDANPDIHGGLFLRRSDDYSFQVIETYPYGDSRQKARENYIEDIDIFADSDDPLDGFSDRMEREFRAVWGVSFEIDIVQEDREAMEWVVEECQMDILRSVANVAREMYWSDYTFSGDYWDELESTYGITRDSL